MLPRTLLFGVALLLIAASCGEDEGAGTNEEMRTIRVTALDELTFDPSSIEVEVGATVRFVVSNASETEHEFVVGDEEMQEMAEEQAMQGEHGHVEAMASLSLAPGETKETTITFEQPGELLYGCHVTGHYDGGMVGTILVR
jgi:uncharacterized cupredoxin-like copper-binding protein